MLSGRRGREGGVDNTPLTPLARVKGHNTSPSQGQRSHHLPLDNTSLPPRPGSKVTTPLPGQHLPPPSQGQRSQHLPWTTPPPPPPPGQHCPPPWTTLPPPPELCAGGRYASYWNAFLFLLLLFLLLLISACQRSYGKVMFSDLLVCHFVHRRRFPLPLIPLFSHRSHVTPLNHTRIPPPYGDTLDHVQTF